MKCYHEPFETGEQQRDRVAAIESNGIACEMRAAAEAAPLESYDPDLTGSPDRAVARAKELEAKAAESHVSGRTHSKGGGSTTRKRRKPMANPRAAYCIKCNAEYPANVTVCTPICRGDVISKKRENPLRKRQVNLRLSPARITQLRARGGVTSCIEAALDAVFGDAA